MELTRPFARIGKGDAALAGGKGASLGEMTQAGIPVPPGFVLLANAFERFLTEADLSQELDAVLDNVNREEMRSVDQASEKIKRLILAAEMPEDIAAEIQKNFESLDAEFVAVRSSATAEDGATAAWAGQLETYLNTTQTDLLENVKHCWASLFTPRAIFYRYEKGMHGQKISVAVVIQKMVQSEVSGIAFSVHPVTEDYNQMIIEAGFGLGEAIVSGQVTPDSYVVEKSPRRTIDINITTQTRALVRGKDGGNEWKNLTEEEGSKPSLSKEQVAELAEIILRIEKHYGFPCDIEWAFEAGKFFITQSRPITTLSPKNVPEAATSQNPEEYFRSLRFHKKGRWSTYPLDTELWHIAENAAAFKEKFGLYKEVLAICEFGEQYWNHMYVPVSFEQKLYARIREITASGPKALETLLMQFYKEREIIRRELPKAQPKDITKLSNTELAALFKHNRNEGHVIVRYDQFTWQAEEYWSPLMDAALEKYGLVKDSPEYTDALFALMKPREISTTLEEKRAVIKEVLDIKAGKQTEEKAATSLAAAYGWMPVLAFGVPWDATRYTQEIDDTMQKDEETLRREFEELQKYTELRDKAFDAIVAKYSMKAEDVQLFVDYGLAIDTRNEAEYVASFIGGFLMPIFEEIRSRLGLTMTELRSLLEKEVIACLKGEANAKKILAERGHIIAWGLTPEGTRITYTGALAEELFSQAESENTALSDDTTQKRGITANRGKARGIVRRVSSPEENSKVGPGDILVAYSTMVDNLPAMKKAAAFVTESGGLTCHAAVVAREFGVPCVVGYRGAMTDFNDGDEVEVDADSGIVRKV